MLLSRQKMAIDLPATVKGKITEIRFKAGDHVVRDDVLLSLVNPIFLS